MPIKWIDVSIPLEEGMTVWPGDTAFSFIPDGRIKNGDNCNTSVITIPTHAGTHCDAPWHFEDDGKRLHVVDTQFFFGEAKLIDTGETDLVEAQHLGREPLPERILIKTKNSAIKPNSPFNESYVALSEEAAERLVEENVRLVGVDYLSVAPYKNSAPVHHILLQNEIFIIEGLCLADFEAGNYSFIALPMALVGADGAPCRAFMGVMS